MLEETRWRGTQNETDRRVRLMIGNYFPPLVNNIIHRIRVNSGIIAAQDARSHLLGQFSRGRDFVSEMQLPKKSSITATLSL